MPANRKKIDSLVERLVERVPLEELAQRLSPKYGKAKSRVKHVYKLDKKSIKERWSTLKANTELSEEDEHIIADPLSLECIESFSGNIENCIGTVKVPVGVAGPLRVNGLLAQGDYYIPLATTEATLVASYSRGACLITEAGGCTTFILNDGISRSPGFVFRNLLEVSSFVLWVHTQFDTFKKIAESTTSYGKLIDTRTTTEGNHVYMNFDFFTEDAAGQNMTTIATDAVVDYIKEHAPIRPKYAFVEANFSGDKKASALSYLSVRGKKVTAEILLEESLVKKYLHTEPSTMVELWRLSAMGGVMSGTIGVQGHFANALAAIYIATGQDAACVSESSVGITRMELTNKGQLYTTVTLPNIIIGTVGGGTKLPSQSVGLKMMGLKGEGHAHAFAEICAACCLAGELSIIGALSAGHFSSSHQRLSRRNKKN